MNLIKKIFVGAASLVAAVCLFSAVNANAASSTSWNFKDSNFKNLGTISSTKTVDNLTLNATSSKTMQVKANSVTVSGTSYTYCLALGGAGTTSYRSVKVPVSGSSTIKVTMDAAASRTLVVANSSGSKLGSMDASTSAATKSYSYSGSSGYVYLYSSNSNINLYKIQVDSQDGSSSSSSGSSSSGSSSSGSSSSTSGSSTTTTVSGKSVTLNGSKSDFTAATSASSQKPLMPLLGEQAESSTDKAASADLTIGFISN